MVHGRSVRVHATPETLTEWKSESVSDQCCNGRGYWVGAGDAYATKMDVLLFILFYDYEICGLC